MQIPEGPVVIAPLQAFEVAGAAVLVARAFAGSPGLFSFEGISFAPAPVPAYLQSPRAQGLRRASREHYTKVLAQASQAKGLILSARLTPTGAAPCPALGPVPRPQRWLTPARAADPQLLPKRRDSLMIGTMCISCAPGSHVPAPAAGQPTRGSRCGQVRREHTRGRAVPPTAQGLRCASEARAARCALCSRPLSCSRAQPMSPTWLWTGASGGGAWPPPSCAQVTLPELGSSSSTYRRGLHPPTQHACALQARR